MAGAGLLGLSAVLARSAPAYAWTQDSQALTDPRPSPANLRSYDLEIDDYRLMVNGRPGKAMAINGTVPGRCCVSARAKRPSYGSRTA